MFVVRKLKEVIEDVKCDKYVKVIELEKVSYKFYKLKILVLQVLSRNTAVVRTIYRNFCLHKGLIILAGLLAKTTDDSLRICSIREML